MDREFAGLADFFADLFEENLLVVLLTLLRVQIGCKDPSGGVGRMGCPRLRVGQHDELRPHRQRRQDLEGLGERSRLVSTQELSDPG